MTRSTPSRHSVVLTATTRRKSVRIQQRGIDIVALPRLTAYHRRQLARATLDNTPAFAIPQTPVWARIVDVYDGDSLTAAFKLHGRMYSWTVRVFGIDTPELKISTLFPASERERKRALGYEVADYVRSLLLGNTNTVNGTAKMKHSIFAFPGPILLMGTQCRYLASTIQLVWMREHAHLVMAVAKSATSTSTTKKAKEKMTRTTTPIVNRVTIISDVSLVQRTLARLDRDFSWAPRLVIITCAAEFTASDTAAMAAHAKNAREDATTLVVCWQTECTSPKKPRVLLRQLFSLSETRRVQRCWCTSNATNQLALYTPEFYMENPHSSSAPPPPPPSVAPPSVAVHGDDVESDADASDASSGLGDDDDGTGAIAGVGVSNQRRKGKRKSPRWVRVLDGVVAYCTVRSLFIHESPSLLWALVRKHAIAFSYIRRSFPDTPRKEQWSLVIARTRVQHAMRPVNNAGLEKFRMGLLMAHLRWRRVLFRVVQFCTARRRLCRAFPDQLSDLHTLSAWKHVRRAMRAETSTDALRVDEYCTRVCRNVDVGTRIVIGNISCV